MYVIKHSERNIEEAQRAFKCVYVKKLFHDNGLMDSYTSYLPMPELIDADSEYEMSIYGLQCIAVDDWSGYSEEDEIEIMYFSNADIMEYYRLCREYSKQFKVTLQNNPYMRTAAVYVRNQLDQGCYHCEYTLHTRVNRKNASGIEFRMWPEFEWHHELLILIIRIYNFYKDELKKMKKEMYARKRATKVNKVKIIKEAA